MEIPKEILWSIAGLLGPIGISVIRLIYQLRKDVDHAFVKIRAQEIEIARLTSRKTKGG
tara:strand:- start:10679 stop:10855 length:177 start_codon:yes stop_codon:yes gene_type:complete